MGRTRYQKAWAATTLLWIFVTCPAPAARAAAALPQLIEVTLSSSLEMALWTRSPVEGRALAAQVARLWPGTSHKGDRVTLLFRPGDRPGAPRLEALHYRGLKQSLEAYLFAGSDGIERFYDAQGQRLEAVMENPPVPAYEQITERVQRGRGKRPHTGDDLRAKLGSPVLLPFAGVVTRTNWHRRRNGLCVEVLLDAGYTARFLHLAKVEADVRKGTRLPAGTLLGQVGSTGRSTGPHLHYELFRHGRPVEPLSVHGRSRARLEPDLLARFALVRDALRRQLGGAVTPSAVVTLGK